ncbi:uncharacterized protein LOC103396149 isoform X1 [Cynoglossus semilaevis]|uniref:uncharacterized protein LOC103396149 isoform X1 n=1 Tax=Cynoglossus semilaevis TaxID=244447 RepID=UPI000D62B130|nr:uncharacterized protein LOC103396149 isoform X1 [Cynoglossus semilaevis]
MEVSAAFGGPSVLSGPGTVCLQFERAAHRSDIWNLVRSGQIHKVHYSVFQLFRDCWKLYVFYWLFKMAVVVQSPGGRCRCRSGILHLWFLDPKNAAGGTSQYLCSNHGLSTRPVFNLFLRLCDFKLGPFVVNKYTSPGIFMCLLWLLIQCVVVFMYWDVPPLSSEDGAVTLEMKRGGNDDDGGGDDEEEVPLMPSGGEESAPAYRALGSEQLEIDASSETHCERCVTSTSNPFRNFSLSREFLREEVVVLLTAQFITLFNQTALETMVTPMTQRYFGFAELGNSLMYGLCGVEVILGFFFVRWLSSKVADRVVLMVGLVICCAACVWSLIFLCDPRGGYEWELTAFVVGVFLQLLGLPFVAVSQVSLFSKVTAEKTQGFSQGVRRSVGGLATILGPLWAGGLTNHLYIMLGMMLALLMMITVMAVLSYEHLAEPRTVQSAQSSDSGG